MSNANVGTVFDHFYMIYGDFYSGICFLGKFCQHYGSDLKGRFGPISKKKIKTFCGYHGLDLKTQEILRTGLIHVGITLGPHLNMVLVWGLVD
jgi:hypothetical protein